MHSHPDVVAYGITSGKVKFTLAGGQSFEAELTAGEAMYVDGQDHATENIGDTELRVLLVELK